MNIAKTLNQYKEECVFFSEPIKNNIMSNGNFIRIIYSNSNFILNGIYLLVPIQYNAINKYYNKFRCTFDINSHYNLIQQLFTIEENLLKKLNITNKRPIFKINEQLKNGYIKIFSDNIENMYNCFLLKIAGVWETELEFGLTYKFIHS
jgi:hypothetical protein